MEDLKKEQKERKSFLIEIINEPDPEGWDDRKLALCPVSHFNFGTLQLQIAQDGCDAYIDLGYEEVKQLVEKLQEWMKEKEE